MKRLLAGILILVGTQTWAALGQSRENEEKSAPGEEHCWTTIKSINITVLDIYDADQTAWYQRLADATKINTKEHVVMRLLPFVLGDPICQSQIDETERILRAVRYLREPHIKVDTAGNMQIEVRDSWTLFPTFSAGRSGGKDHFSFGVRDNNLLGLGLGSTFSYKSDEQQSGYRFRLTSPFYPIDKATVEVVLEDYEEGTSSKLTFNKPFYTQADPTGYGFSLSEENLQYTLFHNIDSEFLYLQQVSSASGQFGWLTNLQANQLERVNLGAFQLDKQINSFDQPLYKEFTTALSQDMLFASYDYQQLQYTKLRNLRLISTIEDVNFGLGFSFKMGVGNYSLGIERGNYLHLGGQLTNGWHLGELLLFNDLQVISELYSESENYLKAINNFEAFYDIPDVGTIYWGTELSYLSHYYFQVQSIGDETGVRGFPLQYQHGKNRWVTHFEFHQYTDLDLFESVYVGVAYYIDAGRAWNNPELLNIEDGSLHSFGIGLRFYPHVVSGKNVVHVDLTKAFSNISDVDGYEIRIAIDNRF